MNIEAELSKLGAFPPIEPEGTATEVGPTGLALQRRDDFTGVIAFRFVIARFRNDYVDVSRLAVVRTASDDEADRALVCFRLQLRQISSLSPAEARAEVTQPTAKIVRTLFVNRDVYLRRDGLTLSQLLDRRSAPPNAWQINTGERAEVVRVDVAERFVVMRLVTKVRWLIDSEIVDDRRDLFAEFIGGGSFASRLARFVQ